MTFGFVFWSVLYAVGFSSGSCTFFFTFVFGSVRFCSVRGKTWVLVRFVLAGSGFFLISKPDPGNYGYILCAEFFDNLRLFGYTY